MAEPLRSRQSRSPHPAGSRPERETTPRTGSGFSNAKSAITSSCMNCAATGRQTRSGNLDSHSALSCSICTIVQLVTPAFRLHGYDVLAALRVDSHVQFVCLDLPDAAHRCPKVILQRVARDSRADVDETVVPHYGQQGLLVVERMHRDDARGGVGNLGGSHLLVGGQTNRPGQDEAVPPGSRTANDPLTAAGGRGLHGLRNAPPIPCAVDDVTDVARARKASPIRRLP